jgi:hypothetical protein
VILTASVLFPDQTNEKVILAIMVVGTILALIAAVASGVLKSRKVSTKRVDIWDRELEMWRMPPLSRLRPMAISRASKTWMLVLRFYLILAVGLVLIRIVTLAVRGF